MKPIPLTMRPRSETNSTDSNRLLPVEAAKLAAHCSAAPFISPKARPVTFSVSSASDPRAINFTLVAANAAAKPDNTSSDFCAMAVLASEVRFCSRAIARSALMVAACVRLAAAVRKFAACLASLDCAADNRWARILP